MIDDHKNWLEVLFDAFTIGDGCATFLAYVVIFVGLIVVCDAMWILFTTPSPPPAPTWDPAWIKGVPGFGGVTPTPLPDGSWLPW